MNDLMLDDHTKIACICEGASEAAIINILLDKDVLIFNREHLIDGNVLMGKNRRGDYFKDNILPMIESDFHIKKLYIFIIQDTMTEFNTKKFISHKFEYVYYFITKPEIEMLMIHSLDLYKEFCKVKSEKKPSIFMGEHLKKKQTEVKNTKFIKEFFYENSLIDAIESYAKNHKINKADIRKKYRFLKELLKI